MFFLHRTRLKFIYKSRRIRFASEYNFFIGLTSLRFVVRSMIFKLRRVHRIQSLLRRIHYSRHKEYIKEYDLFFISTTMCPSFMVRCIRLWYNIFVRWIHWSKSKIHHFALYPKYLQIHRFVW